MQVFSQKTSKIQYSTMIHSSSLLASAILALLCTISVHAADDYQEARRLHAQGNLPAALERVEAQLARQPRDARLRFLKGVIQSQQGQNEAALDTFTALTREFPELPEPHNNLAVLHAKAQRYDEARVALETAIRLNPSYARAHQNLGDLYSFALQGQGREMAQSSKGVFRDNFTTSAYTILTSLGVGMRSRDESRCRLCTSAMKDSGSVLFLKLV